MSLTTADPDPRRYNRGRRAVLDIATGLAYLHDCRVLHLDLKPHNVLLSREGVAKIGDVGFSRMMSRTHLSVGGGAWGTYDWAAPEVLMGHGATEKSDVWSLGVILWELCSGLRPRRGQLTLLKVPEDCPAEVAALQVACVSADPARRPTAAKIVQLLMQLPPSRRLPPLPPLPASGQPAAPAAPAGPAASTGPAAPAVVAVPATPPRRATEAAAPRSASQKQQQRLSTSPPRGTAAARLAGSATSPARAASPAGSAGASGSGQVPSAAAGPLVQAVSLPSCLGDAVQPQLSPAATISTAGSSLLDSSLIMVAAAAAAAEHAQAEQAAAATAELAQAAHGETGPAALEAAAAAAAEVEQDAAGEAATAAAAAHEAQASAAASQPAGGTAFDATEGLSMQRG